MVLEKLAGTPGVPTVRQKIESENVNILVMSPVCEQLSGCLTAKHIQQLINILAQAEEKNIVHTDLRPPNLLTKDGQIYLIDWGYARQKGFVAVESLDLRFASPEILKQAMGGASYINISTLDDCWSVFLCALSIYVARTTSNQANFIAPEPRGGKIHAKYASEIWGFGIRMSLEYPCRWTSAVCWVFGFL
eukprot:TRINITY_DN4499_c0_g1_i4.p1 TRINITY_DN4499_c0_g1~~TRINITY_DN4499_c0_g1_i4.p1  ORF type:complete len:191 (+),score=38.39 TRINITY_DN4499_c0_g1_i4:673-1245(+)